MVSAVMRKLERWAAAMSVSVATPGSHEQLRHATSSSPLKIGTDTAPKFSGESTPAADCQRVVKPSRRAWDTICRMFSGSLAS